MTETEDRLTRLESAVEHLQEAVEREQQGSEASAETSDARTGAAGEPSVDRRTALQAGGILGLLGLGATTQAGAASGQVGTASRPLEVLHTAAIDGPVVDVGSPITSFATSPDAESVPVRDGSGELAVADATSDAHAVNRGQDVTWSGQHDFDSMPDVGGSPVVESDSNSDGEWIRWADGTQICTFNRRFSGDGWQSSPPYLSFPAGFTDDGYRFNLTPRSDSTGWFFAVMEDRTQRDSSGTGIRPANRVTDSGTSVDIDCQVVGRWQ